jgi:hypothetical protein
VKQLVHKLQKKNVLISGEEIFLPTSPEAIEEQKPNDEDNEV